MVIVEVHPQAGRARSIANHQPKPSVARHLSQPTICGPLSTDAYRPDRVAANPRTRFHRRVDEFIDSPAARGLLGREPTGNPLPTKIMTDRSFMADRQRTYRTVPKVPIQTEVHR